MLFWLDKLCDESRDLGSSKKILLFKFSKLGAFSLVTLSKFIFDESRFVVAVIRLAFAPAKEDSDWAKSVRVIYPFCSLALSNSTCLSNKLTFKLLNFSLLDLYIKSK